jgi:hypothetical protein
MFKKSWFSPWINNIDEGFSVFVSRAFAIYREGARRLTLSIDNGGRHGATIFLGSGARWDDNPGASIDAETQMMIIERVKKALEWSGLQVSLFGGI